jgi:16S rRNA (guanine527-N7)-methyltransferase
MTEAGPRRPLQGAAAALGIPLLPAQADLFERYIALLNEWRPRVRITGAVHVETVETLVAGALCLLPFLPGFGRLVDLGSGGGVVGIPLAILRPMLRVVLAEAAQKKAAFLGVAARELGLANLEVAAARAEDLGREASHRGAYDAVSARALAPVRVLVEYALPLLRVGGVAVFPKGRGAADEVRAAAPALRTLGGEAAVHAPAAEWCSPIVIVRKTGPTPGAYPRRSGVAVRRPL